MCVLSSQVLFGEPQELVFIIPIFEPLPPQYFVRAVSDQWLGAEAMVAISFQHLILPELHPPHTRIWTCVTRPCCTHVHRVWAREAGYFCLQTGNSDGYRQTLKRLRYELVDANSLPGIHRVRVKPATRSVVAT